MSVVPIWMDAPATGAVRLPPPIDSLDQTLPFGGLAWEDFERLTLRIIRREADVSDCAIYGTPGQNQEGIDILAVLRTPDAEKWCYQCKRVKSFGPADIRDAVTTFLGGKFAMTASTLVLCVSASLQRRDQVEAIESQRKLLRGRGINLLTWDGSEGGLLVEKLKANPHLVDDFFGREWVRRFNGNSAADSLGIRLDGFDQAKLLHRLRALYIALFNQFDPGPRVPGGACSNFGFRYVQPDILKTVRVEGSSQPSGESGVARASDAQHQLAPLTDPPSSFDTRRPLMDWLRQRPLGTILGNPGYGKSAFLKFLTLAILEADEALEGTVDSDQLTRVPVWMSFAAFSSAISRDFNTSVSSYFSDWLSRNSFADVTPLVERALHSSHLLLLIDGLDEVPSEGNARIALDRLVAFVEGTNSHVICTSRPRGFAALGVPASWDVAELAPLSESQISELAQKSIALTNETPTSLGALSEALQRAAMEASRYLAAVRSNERTHQLARTPLLCLALLDLFRQSSRLPEDRVSVYRQIIDLLIARHPGQRARAADDTSTQSQALVRDTDLKRMLGRLASFMQSTSSVTFTRAVCNEVFVEYLKDESEGLGRPHGEARDIADNLLQSLVARLGIIVERSPHEFAFAHLSLQEFLTAETLTLNAEESQLNWICEHWPSPFSREVVLSWFGIQGALGRKDLASRAVRLIREQSGTDRLGAMRALELSAELACSDLGLPVRDSRELVRAAFHEIRTSPFAEYQESLSKFIALGAIASSVKDECRECVRSMLPGRSEHFRTDLLKHLKTWSASTDLRDALFQALLDEQIRVRRTSAATLAAITWPNDETRRKLVSLATADVRPEIRAAALYGLRSNLLWFSDAIVAAKLNVEPSSPELLLETVFMRVAEKSHTKQDLMDLFWAWESGLDYWLRDSLYECLLSGWKGTTELRTLLSEKYLDEDQRIDREPFLALLAESHPGDPEVAKLIVAEFSNRLGLGLDRGMLWPALIKGFRGHPEVAPALWAAITKEIKEEKRIFWHPSITPAFVVVGTDAARDALLEAYAEADDGMERHWIAKALIDGWFDDSTTARSLEAWAADPDPKISAPLTEWISQFLSEPKQIRDWLIIRAKSTSRGVAADTIWKLLDEFPDEEVLALCEQRLKDDDIWYYNRIALEAKLAAATPRTSFAQSVFERSLAELDGPPIRELVAIAEHSPDWRSKVLTAASPTVLGVRQAIVSVFRDRVAPDDVLISCMPEHMAEVSGPVRTTMLCARAVSSKNRSDPKHAVLVTQLQEELKASGTYFQSRRLSAVAAMAELGRFDLAVAALTGNERGLGRMLSGVSPDPVAIQTLLSHLSNLEAASLQSGQAFQLGSLDEFIRQPVMIDALASNPHFAAVVDEKLRGPLPQWDSSSFLELAAVRLDAGDLLLQKLLSPIAGSSRGSAVAVTAAKLLARHFGGRQDVWDQIRSVLQKNVGFGEGLTGHLALAWPSELPFLRSLQTKQSPLDELVFRSLEGNSTGANESLLNVIQNHHPNFWLYLRVGHSLLVEWAALPIARTILSELTLDRNGTKSMVAIEILLRVGATSALPLDELKRHFLDEISGAHFPREGFDIFTARYKSWCSGVFAALYGTTRNLSPLRSSYMESD